MRTVAPVKSGGKLYPGIHLGETVVSDMIRIACVACRAKIGVNPSQIGSKIRCPKCMEEFVAEEPKAAKPAVAKPVLIKTAEEEEIEGDYQQEKADLKKKRRNKEKKETESFVISMIVGGVVLLALMGAGLFYLAMGSAPLVAPDKPDFSVDSDEIYGHFKQNVADADMKYIGKWAKVEGIVKGVKRADDGGYYLYLHAGWDDRGIVVFCDQAEASKTEFGDQVYATGYVKKFVAGQVQLWYSKIDVKIKVNKNQPNPNAR